MLLHLGDIKATAASVFTCDFPINTAFKKKSTSNSYKKLSQKLVKDVTQEWQSVSKVASRPFFPKISHYRNMQKNPHPLSPHKV